MGEVTKTCLMIKLPSEDSKTAMVAMHEVREDGTTIPLSAELPWGVQYLDIDYGCNYSEKEGWLMCESNGDRSMILHLKRWRGSHIDPHRMESQNVQ